MKDIKLLRQERNEFGRQIRSGYEKHTVKAKYSDIHSWGVREPDVCPTLTTYLLDILLLEEIEDSNIKDMEKINVRQTGKDNS